MVDSSGKLQGTLNAEKYIPHGAFNPLAANKKPKKNVYDTTGYDPFNSLKEELTKKYTPDVFELKSEWNAIVLKKIEPESSISSNPILTALHGLLSDTSVSVKQDTIKFIGRIPEIHGCLLLPNDDEDNLVLSMYPVFEGAAALGQVAVGDVVRVTFDNLNNFSNPKYIGPISSPGSVVGNGNAVPIGAQSAFSNSPQASTTSVTVLSNINNNPNRIGHPVTSGFPNSLELLRSNKDKIPRNLYERARARGFNTDLVPVQNIDVDQHLNVYISVAVSEVIEQYWRQQFPDATVRIIFNTRNRSERDRSNSHGIGAAIDFTVHQGGTTIPVLQTWAAMTRLGKAGRLPLGGRGVYLNTSPNGIKGIKPEECGEASPGQGKPKSALPQGGSAGIHYDWRNSFGNQRGPHNGKPNTWISADIDGDGHDEYELGEPNSQKGTDANYVLTYLGNTLPNILTYWRQQGVYDTTLPQVGPSVFNILQILELEQ